MADVNIDVLRINTAPAEKSMGSLKQQLKQVREEMVQMRLNGEETSEAYKKLAARAGELSKAMKLASNDIGEASTTFSNTVKYVSGSLAGVTGAVQAATGALSLMGVEMGSDTKLMKTLVAAMSVTSGLTAIQASVEAFKKLATNIKRSTLAQQGLNAAIKANPIMFAVGAIAALAAGLFALTQRMKEQKKEAEELAKQNRILVGTYRDLKAEMTTYEDELNMKSSSWMDKVIQKYKELNYAAHGNSDVLKSNIKTLIKEAVEQGNVAEKQLLTAVDYYQQMEDANLRYNLALMEEDSEEREKNLEEHKKSLEARKTALISYYKEIKKIEDDEAAKRSGDAAKQKADADAATAKLKAEKEAREKLMKEVLKSLETEREQELITLTEKYMEQRALLEEFGQDTTALTEKFRKDRAAINQKYDDLEEQARKEEAETRYNSDRLAAETKYYEEKKKIVEKNEKDINKQLNKLDLEQIETEKKLLKQQLDDKLIMQEEYQNSLSKLELEQAEIRKQIAEDEAEAKEKTQENYMNAMSRITSSLGSILGTLADVVGADTEAYKNLKAAQAIISTLAAAVAAFAGITESTGGWGIAAAIAEAAAVTAAGFAEVRKIYAVDTTGGKNSTSSTGINMGAVNVLGESNYNNTRLLGGNGGVYDLSRLEQSGNQKVYVTTHDITNTGKKVEVTTRRNTF